MLQLAMAHQGRDMDRMRHYARQAVVLSRGLGRCDNEAYGLRLLGIHQDITGKPVEAMAYLDSALAINETISDTSGILACLSSIAVLHGKTGGMDDRMAANVRVLEMTDGTTGWERYRISALDNMAGTYKALGEKEKALEHYCKARDEAQALGADRELGQVYNNLGSTLMSMDRDEEALEALLASRRHKERVGDPHAMGATLRNIFALLVRQEKYDEARAYLEEAMEIEERLGDLNGLATSLAFLGETERKRGRHASAAAYLKRSSELFRSTGNRNMLMRVLQVHAEMLHRAGRSGEAYDAFVEYDALRDSLFRKDKLDALTEMQERYESEKKAQQIELLEKENLLKEEENARQRLARNTFMGGFAMMLLLAVVFFGQRNRIRRERDRSDKLLLNILPFETAQELKEKGSSEARMIDHVTVLFTDFKGFTAMSEVLSPKDLVRDLHECFSAFDAICQKHGIEKIKTIGDAYMAAGGIPVPNDTHAVDVVSAALEMRDFIAEGKARKIAAGLPYFEIRIGVHTGPVVAGIVGLKKFQYDIWGDTVNTAARMESSGEVGRVNISGATYSLLKHESVDKDGSAPDPQPSTYLPSTSRPINMPPAGSPPTHHAFTFSPRGKIHAKGKGDVEMWFVDRPLT